MRARRPIPPAPTRLGMSGARGALGIGGLPTACDGNADDAKSPAAVDKSKKAAA